jgi:hypothetical protein
MPRKKEPIIDKIKKWPNTIKAAFITGIFLLIVSIITGTFSIISSILATSISNGIITAEPLCDDCTPKPLIGSPHSCPRSG